MNEAQTEAFEVYWEGLIAQCEQSFPEVVAALQHMWWAAIPVVAFCPLSDMPRQWGIASRMAQASGASEDVLWAYAVIGRWVVDWKVAHPLDDLLSTMGTTSE